jgi:hypothetical protein
MYLFLLSIKFVTKAANQPTTSQPASQRRGSER